MRPPASVQRVPDAAHFVSVATFFTLGYNANFNLQVVQQNPDGVAFALTQILTGAAWPRAAL